MTSITKQHKTDFVEQMVREIFAERIEKAKKAIQYSGTELMEALISRKHWNALKQMPSYMHDTKTQLSIAAVVTVKNGGKRNTYETRGRYDVRTSDDIPNIEVFFNENQSPVPVPVHLHPSHYGNDPIRMDADGIIVRAIAAKQKEKEQLTEDEEQLVSRLASYHKKWWPKVEAYMLAHIERNKFKQNALTILEPIRTVKRLRSTWPEIADRFIEFSSLDTKGTALVPVQLISEINQILEQAKKAA